MKDRRGGRDKGDEKKRKRRRGQKKKTRVTEKIKRGEFGKGWESENEGKEKIR